MNTTEKITQTPDFLYVLDLDRTLIDSEVAADAMYLAAAKYGVPKHEIKAARQDIEASDTPFDAVKFLEERVSDTVLDEIEKEFFSIMATRDDFFHEGAEVLLEQLESEAIPYIITTYGGDKWQVWKLKAAGLLHKDYIITQTERKKGRWIARDWQTNDGMYAPPLEDENRRNKLRAKHVVVVDDKRESFEGLPEGNVSVLVRHIGREIRPSQETGDFEPDIVVSGLWDLDLVVDMKTPEREEEHEKH